MGLLRMFKVGQDRVEAAGKQGHLKASPVPTRCQRCDTVFPHSMLNLASSKYGPHCCLPAQSTSENPRGCVFKPTSLMCWGCRRCGSTCKHLGTSRKSWGPNKCPRNRTYLQPMDNANPSSESAVPSPLADAMRQASHMLLTSE